MLPDNFPKDYMDRLIAVTNRHLTDESRTFMQQIEKIGHTHPHALILREKDLTDYEYKIIAKDVLAVCNNNNVTCILHTFADIAVELGCRRIHLPLNLLKTIADNDYKTDKGHDLRTCFDAIGTSVHSVEDAVSAEKLGASYATAGHIYATDCKKGLPPRGTEFLKNVCEHVSIPVYAIGGIHFDTAQIDEVRQCGADGACIMSGFMRY